MNTGTITWVGGEHEFCLRIGELRKLQDSCAAGPEEVFNRLRLGTWRVNDLIEPIRLGLIGAGAMETKEAGPFVATLFDQHPKAEFKLVAIAIIGAALVGVSDDPVGEPEGAETPPSENGGSADSTETVQ